MITKLNLNVFTVCVLIAWSCCSKATVILQYHHISDNTPPSTSLSPTLFRQHMQLLSENGYQVLALPMVVEKLKQGQTLPDKSVVITFDDSYDSVYTEAFPLLKAKGWPFTIFVTTGALQQKLAGFTTWEQLREMGEHGATLANHSHSHTHFLRRQKNESESQWRTRIQQDIIQAEKLIEQNTGQAHRLLAYPYGEYDLAVLNLVKSLNFVGFAQQSGPLPNTIESKDDLLALPRFPFGGVYGSLEDFKVKVATVPMPIRKVTVLDSNGGRLSDTLLPAVTDQPVLVIELQKSLQSTVQCFASGQGAIEVSTDDKKIRTMANQALPVGRSRYNCTAATGQPGQFYWYSHFFIRKQANGEWYPEP